jgi:hypothetical protein
VSGPHILIGSIARPSARKEAVNARVFTWPLRRFDVYVWVRFPGSLSAIVIFQQLPGFVSYFSEISLSWIRMDVPLLEMELRPAEGEITRSKKRSGDIAGFVGGSI